MSLKRILLGMSLLLIAFPVQADELVSLGEEPELARSFDYCAWAFERAGKSIKLPDYDALLDRETTTLSPEQRAATALMEAGTIIAQNAQTKETCEKIFKLGSESFDRQISVSLKEHWADAKYRKKWRKEFATVQAELAKLWVEDQAARRVYIASKTDDKTGAKFWTRRLAAYNTWKADAQSTNYMKDLLEDYDWIDRKRFGKRVSMAAWLMVQHADEHVELQKLALSRMEPYLKKRGVDKSNYAFLWDRVAVNTGQKQRYGTQPTWECSEDGNLTLQPLEEPDTVNKRRKKMGMDTVEKSLENMSKSICQ